MHVYTFIANTLTHKHGGVHREISEIDKTNSVQGCTPAVNEFCYFFVQKYQELMEGNLL